MTTSDIAGLLDVNPYPGRGILLGRSADNRHSVLAYFIMGRSENSRNRVFIPTEDGIRTQARDPSRVSDPSLILYHPVRTLGNTTVVANGDHADTLRDALAASGSFSGVLRTRTFEPDAPHFTPRISGLLLPDGSYALSILKSMDGDPSCCCRAFFEYEAPLPGVGHLLHTYRGDGTPLPSFEGEPRPVVLPCAGAAALAQLLWTHLNTENKISLFVRYRDLVSGETDDVIRNRL